VFDRLYTAPLLGWRAFLRSGLFSIILTLILAYEFYSNIMFFMAYMVPEIRYQWFTQILTNIIADYTSLFFIRRWLIIAGRNPLFSLITAPLVGGIIIITYYIIHDVDSFSIKTQSFHLQYILDDLEWWTAAIQRRVSTSRVLLIPVFAVHMWLPLFACGVVFAKVINAIRSSSARMQWFLKRGREHPLQAIGYVAATIVFVGSIIMQKVF
jgi:hypothetical protein